VGTFEDVTDGVGPFSAFGRMGYLAWREGVNRAFPGWEIGELTVCMIIERRRHLWNKLGSGPWIGIVSGLRMARGGQEG